MQLFKFAKAITKTILVYLSFKHQVRRWSYHTACPPNISSICYTQGQGLGQTWPFWGLCLIAYSLFDFDFTERQPLLNHISLASHFWDIGK